MKVFVTYDMSQLFEPAMTYKRSQIVGSQANGSRTHFPSEAAKSVLLCGYYLTLIELGI